MDKLLRLYKLEEIIDRHLVADKQTHIQAEQIVRALIKDEQDRVKLNDKQD